MAQTWDPATYASKAAYVPALGHAVVERLAPLPGERILDLGCGDGALTTSLVEAGATVVGIDASEEMVAAARQRGIDARVGDITALDFDREFDAVFTNAVLHWVGRPAAVIAGVARALRGGGRFVGEFGGIGNVATIAAAIVASLEHIGIDGMARWPWYYPDPDAWAAELRAGAFSRISVELIPRPTPLPGSMADWVTTFAQPFLVDLTDTERADVLADVERRVRPSLCTADGTWSADHVRLRFTATLD
ncbi:MAG: class I SAM-dependent methyltransferase [Acidimicrobiia bacterium]